MNKSLFDIKKMDCPGEEQLIRIKLQKLEGIRSLTFDLSHRKLTVYHEGKPEPILSALDTLDLDTTLVSSGKSSEDTGADTDNKQRKLLWTVFFINFLFFGMEITTGFLSNSMGLVADSLDMLADSIVYALALFAVGGTVARKNNIARLAGYFQILLAITGFAEVVKRFAGIEKMPDFQTMVVVSVLALAANVLCLYLLQKSKSREAHMQAGMIFTSNDVIINTGVIVAGLLVCWLDSAWPDLLIGAVVFFLVARGAWRILQLAK